MGTSQSKAEEFQQTLEERILESIYPQPSAEIIKVKGRRPTKASLHKVEKITLYAEPIGGTNENVVSGRDGRKRIQKTAEWPNSVHGLVTMKFKEDTTSWGTGIMIGSNIVLTAGHNLYDYDTKTYADIKSLKFLPGINGDVPPFGSVEVGQYFVSPNYIKEEKEDYGILILKKSIGEVTGYFGLACLEPEEIKKKTINIIGYPYDKVIARSCIYEMWGMEGVTSDIDQNQGLINYLIDTTKLIARALIPSQVRVKLSNKYMFKVPFTLCENLTKIIQKYFEYDFSIIELSNLISNKNCPELLISQK